MAQPFFDLPDCPDAQKVDVPPAIDQIGLLNNCEVPQSPSTVFQCPNPPLPFPGFFGTVLLQIQITARTNLKHDWQAVEADGKGGWVLTGETGTAATFSEGLELGGGIAKPDATAGTITVGSKVYMARRLEASPKNLFWVPQTHFWIWITGGPDPNGLYDWQQVEDNGSGGWAAAIPAVAGTALAHDGALEVLGLPAIPGDGTVYQAVRAKNGQIRFSARDATTGYMVVAPTGGIPANSSVACPIVSIVGGVTTLLTQTATVVNPYSSAVGVNSTASNPMQVKVQQGQLIPDVDPCSS